MKTFEKEPYKIFKLGSEKARRLSIVDVFCLLFMIAFTDVSIVKSIKWVRMSSTLVLHRALIGITACLILLLVCIWLVVRIRDTWKAYRILGYVYAELNKQGGVTNPDASLLGKFGKTFYLANDSLGGFRAIDYFMFKPGMLNGMTKGATSTEWEFASSDISSELLNTFKNPPFKEDRILGGTKVYLDEIDYNKIYNSSGMSLFPMIMIHAGDSSCNNVVINVIIPKTLEASGLMTKRVPEIYTYVVPASIFKRTYLTGMKMIEIKNKTEAEICIGQLGNIMRNGYTCYPHTSFGWCIFDWWIFDMFTKIGVPGK